MEAAICNHYRADPDAIPSWREYIGIRDEPEWSETKIDVWPGGQGLVVRQIDGERVLDRMTWGFPTKTPRKRPPKQGQSPWVYQYWTNARNLGQSMWKKWIEWPEHRCLVPFTTFAEPKAGQGREEWWFDVPGVPMACFAGIWKPSELGNVFAFLTCEPNPLVAPLHPKAMPVILQPEDYETWLTTDYAGALALQQPFPSQLMSVA